MLRNKRVDCKLLNQCVPGNLLTWLLISFFPNLWFNQWQEYKAMNKCIVLNILKTMAHTWKKICTFVLFCFTIPLIEYKIDRIWLFLVVLTFKTPRNVYNINGFELPPVFFVEILLLKMTISTIKLCFFHNAYCIFIIV